MWIQSNDGRRSWCELRTAEVTIYEKAVTVSHLAVHLFTFVIAAVMLGCGFA